MKRITIVGGGTAGWLAALILQKADPSLDLTVIEASDIPTIGVGEGTTSVFRGMLLELGLDELEFLRETDATIKYGIRHKDWRRIGHSYDGPIDDPHQMADTPPGVTSSWLNQYCVASGRSVTEPHLFTYLMDRGKAPNMADGTPISPFHHAYHFDQSKVGAYLRKKAQGIVHLDARVEDISRNDQGDITALILKNAPPLETDFVIDCTGFRRAIISKLGGQWISYADHLPVNRAMPFWLDHGDTIPPYTLAHAQKAGWMWAIPTQSRMGCGYVYSDAHLTPDQAQAEIEATLGQPITPRADIKIDAGRLNHAWINNCVALGLAQSFFEPLEATSIHGTIVQLLLYTQTKGNKTIRDSYNSVVARQGDDFRTFINLHYQTERTEPFWQAARDALHPDGKDFLELWQTKSPERSDFVSFPGNFPHIEEQLYYPVLDGLGLLSRKAAKDELAQNPKLRAHARKTVEVFSKDYRKAAAKAVDHAEFLKSLQNEPALVSK